MNEERGLRTNSTRSGDELCQDLSRLRNAILQEHSDNGSSGTDFSRSAHESIGDHMNECATVG